MMNVHQEISKIRAFRERNGSEGEIKPFVNMFREGELCIDFYSLRLHLMGLENPNSWDVDQCYREQVVVLFTGKRGFKRAYQFARFSIATYQPFVGKSKDINKKIDRAITHISRSKAEKNTIYHISEVEEFIDSLTAAKAKLKKFRASNYQLNV